MDPSDNACIELLRPKTVPEGLIALGTVIQVSEIQLKLQITGGIVCLVDRSSISEAYSKSIEEQSTDNKKSPPRLPELFKRGQQYVCKIVDRKSRKGYAEAQDIIATLDPSIIHEDNLPKTFLAIPNAPLQCAVTAVEDHGYLMDIGFKGLTGFLSFDETELYSKKHNDGKKLFVGQIVRCCLSDSFSMGPESRVVQLALKKVTLKKSKFTQEKVSQTLLTENCILPGSESFLTVMKVRKDGLLVNFMNEFAGFVDLHHLKEDWQDPKENYKIADQCECTVLYYNKLTKLFGLSITSRLRYKRTLKQLKNYHVGQVIPEAEVAYLDSTRSVYFKVDSKFKAVANVRDALDEDINTMSKDELHLKLDSAYPDHSEHKCRIKSINLADLIIVVSLRTDFLSLPYVSIEELKTGSFIEAIIKKYVKDGIVVTFGLNLRAIILNNDLKDYSTVKSYKRYPLGKTIKCRVLKVDSHKQPPRVFLTNKDSLMKEDLPIVDTYEKSLKGISTCATVIKIKDDGLIVELFDNVKGYIPKRFISKAHLNNIGDHFKQGQVVDCTVYRVDQNRQSLLLGIIPYEEIMSTIKQKKDQKRKRKEEKQLSKMDRQAERQVEKTKKTAKKVLKAIQEPTEKSKLKRDREPEDDVEPIVPAIKSRRQRSEEAKMREEKLREAEKRMMDPDRPPQSILDFEKLVLKTPNSADVWIKYSNFFLENVETEKARIICRRALKTINFRLEKEKLKIWLQLIKIEAKFGGTERLREMIEEAYQTNDHLSLYQGIVRVLISCNELDEAERLHDLLLKSHGKSIEVWLNYVQFHMEHRKDLKKARSLFDKANKLFTKSDLLNFKSRFAQLEFKMGDVERGKTMFENLLSDNPKRTDLWRVYEGMVKKFGLRQLDSEEVREQNEEVLERISESIELVSKKARRKANID